MDNGLKSTWREAAVTQFVVLMHNLSNETEAVLPIKRVTGDLPHMTQKV
jgi:hypothetical protein